jgi:hypothetical protein
VIKGRAGELVWRYDVGAVEDLAGRMACDAGQRLVSRRPVDKAAHDVRIGSQPVHVHETVRGIVDSKHIMRPTDGVANSVQDVRPELCVEGGIVDCADKTLSSPESTRPIRYSKLFQVKILTTRYPSSWPIAIVSTMRPVAAKSHPATFVPKCFRLFKT